MINAYSVSDGLLLKLDCSNDTAGLAEATWIDLLEPTKEEEETVEALLHVDIPTREEMRSIDPILSRSYHRFAAKIYMAGAGYALSVSLALAAMHIMGRREHRAAAHFWYFFMRRDCNTGARLESVSAKQASSSL
jgi:hypothetical protein